MLKNNNTSITFGSNTFLWQKERPCLSGKFTIDKAKS